MVQQLMGIYTCHTLQHASILPMVSKWCEIATFQNGPLMHSTEYTMLDFELVANHLTALAVCVMLKQHLDLTITSCHCM